MNFNQYLSVLILIILSVNLVTIFCDDCPSGEVYLTCGTACPKTCDNYREDIICTKQCVVGCFCRDGQVRRKYDNQCVDPQEC
ncbi:venom peptide SjAPI-2 [Chrysoperla carnea]|uniref:venom peptide SjAPI-2 n=1 Tax=Chrysoperla carnea TaxID=189513 RepID=UPI001D08293F|nr:venom peptide SjAPI-2 [Chrysoperla carnea]